MKTGGILEYLKRTFNSPLKEEGLDLDIKVSTTTIKEEEMNLKMITQLINQ